MAKKKGKDPELERYLEYLKSLDNVNREKVEKIRKLVESGKYRVDPEKVARKMLEDILSEEE